MGAEHFVTSSTKPNDVKKDENRKDENRKDKKTESQRDINSKRQNAGLTKKLSKIGINFVASPTQPDDDKKDEKQKRQKVKETEIGK